MVKDVAAPETMEGIVVWVGGAVTKADTILMIKYKKWTWAGHIMRITGKR